MDVSALTAAVSSGSAVFDILQLIVCRWLFDDSWSLIAFNFKFLVPITKGFDFAFSEPYIRQSLQVHFVCTAVINQPLTNLAVVANCPLRIKTSSFTFLWLILIFLLAVRFSWPLYPSNVPPHFELKSIEMADLKKNSNRRKKNTTNESLNSHWLVLPANCKIHLHLARVVGVLISDPGHRCKFTE